MSFKNLHLIMIVIATGCGILFADYANSGPYTPTANTIILWHLDDGSGNYAANAATGTTDGRGSISNTTAPEPNWTSAGRWDDGMVTSGAEAGTLMGYLYGQSISSAFTVDLWIKPTSNVGPDVGNDASYIVGLYKGFFLRARKSGENTILEASVNDGAGNWVTTATATMATADYLDGEWHQVAMVFHGADDELAIYWDNEKIGFTTAASTAAPTNTYAMTVGITPWGAVSTTNKFQGSYDEVRLSDIAITDFAVPEPGSLALILAGSVLALTRKRR